MFGSVDATSVRSVFAAGTLDGPYTGSIAKLEAAEIGEAMVAFFLAERLGIAQRPLATACNPQSRILVRRAARPDKRADRKIDK